MSFLDRIKSFFAGGPSGHDHDDDHDHDHVGHSHDEPHGGESELEASLGLPTTPVVDPLGTPAPEAAQEPITPPPPPRDADAE